MLMRYLRRRDIQILIALVVVSTTWYGYAQYEIDRHRQSLEELADEERAAFFADVDASEFDVLMSVDSGKTLGFFGEDWGLIRLSYRARGDASMESFEGVEYFYTREDESWIRRDSAGIREPRFIYEVYRQFEAEGYPVDDAAYEQYQR